MSDNTIIYDEEIAAGTAMALTGLDYLPPNVTCKMITTLHDTTIMIHNNDTGTEEEYPLTDTSAVPEPVPTIESSSKEILKKPAWQIIGAKVLLYSLFVLVPIGIAVLLAVSTIL